MDRSPDMGRRTDRSADRRGSEVPSGLDEHCRTCHGFGVVEVYDKSPARAAVPDQILSCPDCLESDDD
jgi:hypothetical protein